MKRNNGIRNSIGNLMFRQIRSALLLASIIFMTVAAGGYTEYAYAAGDTVQREVQSSEVQDKSSDEQRTQSSDEQNGKAAGSGGRQTNLEQYEQDPYLQAVNEWIEESVYGIGTNIQNAIDDAAQIRQQEKMLGTFQLAFDLLSRIKEDTPWLIRVNKTTNTVTLYRIVEIERSRLETPTAQAQSSSSDFSAGLITYSQQDIQDGSSQNGSSEGTEEMAQIRIPVYACPCSTGKNGATPNGTYSIQDHLRWHELMGPTWGQWCSHFAPSYLFHSLPYERPNDPYSMEPYAYNNLGKAVSHGCVRLAAVDAKYLYDHVPVGGRVEIFEGNENDDPLGTPERPYVIDWNHSYDPTDPELPENK